MAPLDKANVGGQDAGAMKDPEAIAVLGPLTPHEFVRPACAVNYIYASRYQRIG